MVRKIIVKAVNRDGVISSKDSYKCSKCYKTVTKYFNYCPYCGEKFEKEKKDGLERKVKKTNEYL